MTQIPGRVPAPNDSLAQVTDGVRALFQGGASAADLTTLQASVNALKAIDFIVRTATGELSAERVLTDTATITWDFSTAGQVKATATSSGARVKSGTFTRDTSLASGTQAITGVGFQPKCIMIVAGINGQASFGLGFDNAVSPFGAADDHVDAANTWVLSSTQSMIVAVTAGNNYQGKLNSLDSDGFTVGWTRVGAPTGTMTVGYLALG